MPKSLPDAQTKRIIVAVGPGPGATEVVQTASRLADAFQADWEAIHVETPTGYRTARESPLLAEALGLAAGLGASVAHIQAATVADGLVLHIQSSSADQLVMGHSRRIRWPFWGRTLLERVSELHPDLSIYLVPLAPHRGAGKRLWTEPSSLLSYGYAAAAVALTIAAALILNRAAGVQFLSFLFLFPVIASAARLGTRPALAAALLSALSFNFFFLEPVHVIKPAAVQSWVMGAVLIAVALYTGALTANLRGRILLSERSAQENARIATFALDLTRVADWTATAQVICKHVGGLLDVQTMLVREISDRLVTAASTPSGASLEPLDQAALEWAWSHDEAAGSGSSVLSTANWHFQPLATSLGTLAVLGLAREDGRNPVPADKAVLLSTISAQAALALERLRLEDQMREASAGAGNKAIHSGN